MGDTTPIAQCLVRRCHGKLLQSKLVIEAYLKAGWRVVSVDRGVTALAPTPPNTESGHGQG